MPDTELSIARELNRLLRLRGLTVAVAEGSTGGRIGERLVRYAGATAYFKGAVVTYDYPSRTRLLGIPETTLLAHGAVSEHVVRAMAEAVRERFDADIGLAGTGVAGPSGQGVGTVWTAVATGEATLARGQQLPRASRQQLHAGFTLLALRLLREAVLSYPTLDSAELR